MIRFLFKQPQPRRFEYKPRFYNERKEQLNARIEAIKRDTESDSGASSEEVLRNRIGHAWRSNSSRQVKSKSNKNILIIVALLSVIAYLVLFN
jgi:hypothetical protein